MIAVIQILKACIAPLRIIINNKVKGKKESEKEMCSSGLLSAGNNDTDDISISYNVQF